MNYKRPLGILITCLLLSLVPVARSAAQEPTANPIEGCWSVVPTPPLNAQSSAITGLSATSPTDVWAAGTSRNTGPTAGGGFAMRYNGTSWQVTATSVLTQPYTLQDIAALTPDSVWAVGSYVTGTTASNLGTGRLILHWDGHAWDASLKGGAGALSAVWATSADDVWAVGETKSANNTTGIVQHWNGQVWSETVINSYTLRDVVALGPDDVWVAGSPSPSGTAVFHWDGERWSPSAGSFLEAYGLVALSANDVWAVGSYTSGGGSYHWDGSAGTALDPVYDRGAQLSSASAFGPDDIWMVGRYNRDALLAHWDGSRWSSPPNPIPGFESGLNEIARVGDELWTGGWRNMNSSDSEAVIARYTSSPCPAPRPTSPLNPPVPLPGTGNLSFVTGNSIRGVFLDYWQEHGGLQQQGYPITSELGEVSDLDGKLYTVQYFERSVFEFHPELRDTPYEVLLSHLGAFQYRRKYPEGAPNQRPNQDAGTLFFPETGKRLGGSFLKYWQEHGGLLQQGYPISDEFTEVSDLDSRPYTVQYFERSVFEWHPENAPPYNVLLSQLGRFRYDEKYNGAPQVPAASEPRRLAPDAKGGRVEGRGRYLLWNDGTNGNLYGYDAEQNRHFDLSDGVSSAAAIDGKRAVWRGRSNTVMMYDLAVGTTVTLTLPTRLPRSPRAFELLELGIDDLMLYYTGKGADGEYVVAVQDTLRREDRAITTTSSPVENLRVSDGTVMWVERTGEGLRDQSLHVWSAQARSEFVPVRGIGAFAGYGASGDYLMWSFYNTISDQATYLYNLRTGTRRVVNTGAASGQVMDGNRIAWARWPERDGGESGGWSIEVYDIETGNITAAVERFEAMPRDLALLDNDMLAFTADLDVGTPGYEVFVADLE